MGGTHDTEGDVRFVLSEKMASLKPKGKEPRSIRVFDSWIAHAENELSIGQSGRLAWLIASTVVAAKLQQVIDCAGASRFSLKGGTLLQHRLGLCARATKDLDGIVTGDIEDFLAALDAELMLPWGPLHFARTDAEIIRVPSRIVKPRRFEMVLSLRGDVWRRIKVEISPDEGQAGSSQEHVAAPKLAGFGLPTPDYLVGLALSYQIAQKVHAATEPHDPPMFRNERPRDVVDLILLKDLAERTGSPDVCDIYAAILDTFFSRGKEAKELGRPVRMWPAQITAYPHWRIDYAAAAESAKLDMSLEEAVDAVNRWLAEIEEQAVKNAS